jgi:hypothetical protein
MCERTCPACRSTAHIHMYGIIGSYIVCDPCGELLANRRDIDAAPLDHPDPEQWRREGSFVREGAEATNADDDRIYRA